VSVVGIDAPAGVVDREGWMADAVARGPVLVVVGRLHGLKRVRWSDSSSPLRRRREYCNVLKGMY